MEAWLKAEMERADVDTDVYLPYMMEFMEDSGAFDCESAAETLSAVMDVCFSVMVIMSLSTTKSHALCVLIEQEKDAKELAEKAEAKWKSLSEAGDEDEGVKHDDKDDGVDTSLADEMVEQLRIAKEAEQKQKAESPVVSTNVVDESERARLVARYGVVEENSDGSSAPAPAAATAGAPGQQGKKGKREKVDIEHFSSDMNKGTAQAMAERQRAELKAAHEAKVEQDKKSREKQKMTREEKKAQRRAACQKVERRR